MQCARIAAISNTRKHVLGPACAGIASGFAVSLRWGMVTWKVWAPGGANRGHGAPLSSLRVCGEREDPGLWEWWDWGMA
eukprot:2915230-Rhodomonas_salina.3